MVQPKKTKKAALLKKVAPAKHSKKEQASKTRVRHVKPRGA